MSNVQQRLDEWRQAERHRDGLAAGSPEWQEADAEVRTAEKAYHAQVAQAFARRAEVEYQDRNRGWLKEPDRRTSESGEGAR